MAFVFQNGTLIETDTDTGKDFFFSLQEVKGTSLGLPILADKLTA